MVALDAHVNNKGREKSEWGMQEQETRGSRKGCDRYDCYAEGPVLPCIRDRKLFFFHVPVVFCGTDALFDMHANFKRSFFAFYFRVYLDFAPPIRLSSVSHHPTLPFMPTLTFSLSADHSLSLLAHL